MSGNLFAGVWLTGTGTDHNVVAGNYIGTDVSGTVAVGNGSLLQQFPDYYVSGGVEIANGAFRQSDRDQRPDSADNAGERNVISGNGPFVGDGVDMYGSGTTGNVVAGNFIGTNATGTAALANGYDDVFVGAISSGNWIGVNPVYGPENADEANVISAASYFGVEIFDTTDVVVAGNLIGTNAAGSAAIPNAVGVTLEDSSNVLIGTTGQSGANTALERNVISGNSDAGVLITTLSGFSGIPAVTTNNLVAGNYIGTNSSGTAPLANGGDGIDVFATGNTIGGTSAGAGNVISGNSGAGILWIPATITSSPATSLARIPRARDPLRTPSGGRDLGRGIEHGRWHHEWCRQRDLGKQRGRRRDSGHRLNWGRRRR